MEETTNASEKMNDTMSPSSAMIVAGTKKLPD